MKIEVSFGGNALWDQDTDFRSGGVSEVKALFLRLKLFTIEIQSHDFIFNIRWTFDDLVVTIFQDQSHFYRSDNLLNFVKLYFLGAFLRSWWKFLRWWLGRLSKIRPPLSLSGTLFYQRPRFWFFRQLFIKISSSFISYLFNQPLSYKIKLTTPSTFTN